MLNLVSKKTFKSALLAGTAATAALAVTAVPAIAQDTSSSVEKVTVTGTRLKKRDYSTTSPITTIGSQSFELTQTTAVEGLLNDLPQLVPGNTITSNNAGGFDYATVDLRGLGAGRTLVLVNGQRLPVASAAGVVDINSVPAGLIDRVEVVTGGASAVYGSDAIAGVVNFVLKKDYEGLELTASAGQAENGLAETRNIQALLGGNFAGGNGNITIYGDYFSREGVYQDQFEFSRNAAAIGYCDGAYVMLDTRAETNACVNAGGFGVVAGGGSGTPAWGWIANNPSNAFNTATIIANPLTAPNFATYDHDCNSVTPEIPYGTDPALSASAARQLSFLGNGAVSPRYQSGSCGVPDRGNGLDGSSSRYNYAPDNYLVIPAERYNLSMFGHYDLEKDLTLNFGAIYSDTYTQVSLAPTPATGLTVTMTPAMTALIGANAPDLLVALNSRPNPGASFTMDRRMNEVGRRVGHFENSSLTMFGSLEGQFDDNWSWELAASFADLDASAIGENSVNATALRQGLAGCQDSAGNPLGAAALPGCVALDIFGAGTLTSTMQDFIRVKTFSYTQVEESSVSGFVTGEAWDLFGAGPLAVVVGAEFRSTAVQVENDNEQRSGNIFGFNAVQDVGGRIDAYEGYTEVALPIVKDQPFIYYLGVEGGYRLSDYSSAGIVHTYKYGGEYSPFEWLKFRGVYNKATRAPNAFELFQNGDQGFPSFSDPCRDNDADGIPTQNENVAVGDEVDAALCAADGVVYPGFVANNAQVEAFAFGNQNLSPETAETTTLGVVLQTGNDWFGIGNLRGSVDKYDIEIQDAVGSLGAQFWLNTCYQNNPPSPQQAAACARVTRDPATGQVDSVNTTIANLNSIATKGIDIQVDYRLDLEEIGLGGVLAINELYSIIDSYTVNGTEFVGTTSASIGGAIFDWKQVTTATYALDDWTMMARWSYVPSLTGSTVGEKTPAASYVDAAVRYAPTDWLAVTLTVSNVADEEAPQTIDGYFSQANTDPQVYDVLGRSWSLSVKTKM